jgi:hypothetical protein
MSNRFSPVQSTGSGPDIDAAVRIAHALEYIAVQLGEINERLANQAEIAEQARPSGLQRRMEERPAKK